MPSSHCQLLDMQLQEWDLCTCNFNKNTLHPQCYYSQPVKQSGSFLTHWMPAQGISSTKSQKPPHLCLLPWGGGRIPETPR